MKCCICGCQFIGFGNNPYPLCHKDDYDSRCCNDCDNVVIQSRMDMAINLLTVEQVQKKYLGKICKRKRGKKDESNPGM